MAKSVSKAQFLDRVTGSRTRWNQLVGEVGAEEAHLPGFCDDWSLKDVMAHIAWFERQMIGMLVSRSFGGSPYWELSSDERNQRIHQEVWALAWSEVQSQADLAFMELMELLKALPEAGLNDPGDFPGMPEDWKPWEVLASNTYEHYEDHAQQARAWIARRQEQGDRI